MYKLSNYQIEAQKALEKSDRCLLLKSIRSGKTLLVLDYIKQKNYKKVLWLVPDSHIRDVSLPSEIEKWNFSLSIQAICYNSLKNVKNTEWDLVVLDEVQKLTENYYKSLTTLKYSKLIAMTGTLPNKKVKRELLFDKLLLTLVYSFTTDDAVDAKIVAPYDINVIEIPLSKQNNIPVTYKKNNIPTTFFTSEIKSYNYLSKRIEENFGIRKKMLSLERMRFLNTLESKIIYIKEYLKLHNNKRILIFVATREMADKCSKYIYHGTTDDTYYDLFKNKKINHLILVEKGGIGHTYEDLDGCLLTNVNSSNTITQQKIFRTILFREGYKAKIDVLISKNTIQKKWLEESLYDLKKSNVHESTD